jgi:hypothetical protein
MVNVRWPPAWQTVGAMNQLWDIRQPVGTLAEDIIRIRYQEATSEDTEDFMCGAVTAIFGVCKPVKLLQLLVVTSCMYKCSINPITNPSLVYSHIHTRDNILQNSNGNL